MIEINFPEDSSSLVFLAAPSANFIYMLARAVKHYGADNVRVIDITPVLYGTITSHTAKQRSVDAVLDTLGIPIVRRAAIPKFLGDVKTSIGLLSTIKAAEQVISDVLGSDELKDPLIALTTVSVMHAAGIIDDYCMLQASETIIVLPLYDDSEAGLADTQLRTTLASNVNVWNPLIGVTTEQLFGDIQQQEFMPLIDAIHHCIHDRPIPCGTCSGCTTYKKRLLESDLL